jgi:hypothetical protein
MVLAILLLASIQVSLLSGLVLVACIVLVCIPSSRLAASLVEGKPNTYTVAGAAFVTALLLPPVLWLSEKFPGSCGSLAHRTLPIMATAAIAYAMGEGVGRLACISFGCCYGMSLRQASPWLARTFGRYNTVFYGKTKKAAYASGLDEEPLIPVQALTSIVFVVSGLVGLSCFLAEYRWLAVIIPVIGTWGWRVVAERLRADYRGEGRISAYQAMSVAALIYLLVFALVVPNQGPQPNIIAGLSKISSLGALLFAQVSWAALFIYYGRSQVTSSFISFHLVKEQI